MVDAVLFVCLLIGFVNNFLENMMSLGIILLRFS